MLRPLVTATRVSNVIGSTYLTPEYGKLFKSPAAFGNKFRKWVIQANLVDAVW